MNDKNTELPNFQLNEDPHFNIIKTNENNESSIAEKNELNRINKKLKILLNKEHIANSNVNSNLLIDGIILDMED